VCEWWLLEWGVGGAGLCAELPGVLTLVCRAPSRVKQTEQPQEKPGKQEQGTYKRAHLRPHDESRVMLTTSLAVTSMRDIVQGSFCTPIALDISVYERQDSGCARAFP